MSNKKNQDSSENVIPEIVYSIDDDNEEDLYPLSKPPVRKKSLMERLGLIERVPTDKDDSKDAKKDSISPVNTNETSPDNVTSLFDTEKHIETSSSEIIAEDIPSFSAELTETLAKEESQESISAEPLIQELKMPEFKSAENIESAPKAEVKEEINAPLFSTADLSFAEPSVQEPEATEPESTASFSEAKPLSFENEVKPLHIETESEAKRPVTAFKPIENFSEKTAEAKEDTASSAEEMHKFNFSSNPSAGKPDQILSTETLSINEIYRKFNLSLTDANTIYMVENYIKALPEGLPTDIKLLSVLNILKASKLDASALLNDGSQRLEVLSKYYQSYSRNTDEVINENEQEIRKLMARIEYHKKIIDEKKKARDIQKSTVEYEIHRIRSIIEFTEGNKR